MDKDHLVKRIMNPAFVEHAYAIAFFVVFIFSLLLVVRPSVTTIFTENSQLAQLKQANQQYGQTIETVKRLQALISAYQADFPLLDEAIPDRLRIYQIIADAERLPLASDSAKYLDLGGFDVGVDRALHTKKKDSASPYQIYTLTFQVDGDFDTVEKLIRDIQHQRRVKTIRNLTVSRAPESSASGKLNLQLALDIYTL